MKTETRTLTPYDTGVRAEPHVNSLPTNDELAAAPPLQRVLLEDRYGRVDFEDDESHTLCQVWLERTDEGQEILHVQPLGADVILVQVHG